jgi:DNA polymerase III alpha subunit
METKLRDRILFYDGSSAYESGFVEKLLVYGPGSVFSTKKGGDVPYKGESKPLNPIHWDIPEEYLELDIYEEIYEAASLHGPEGLERVEAEREEFEKRGMFPLLHVLVYIRDELEKQGKVWGVGRGSSCALFTLYLLGIHSVNSLEYDLPLDEFFR